MSAAIVLSDQALEELAAALVPLVLERVAAQLGAGVEDGWLSTRAAAEYAGCSPNALRKAMAAREVEFEQDCPRGKAWFKRSAIDAWRRGGG